MPGKYNISRSHKLAIRQGFGHFLDISADIMVMITDNPLPANHDNSLF